LNWIINASLAAVLNVMSDCKLNLTKINRPKLKRHGNILFVDVTFEKYDYAKAKSLLNIMAEYFKVLGEYKNTKI
jgi:prephenate dehydratase